MDWRPISAAMLVAIWVGTCGPAAAQTAGTVFVPDSASPHTKHRRSIDRERVPGAWGITDEQWDKFKDFAIASGKRLKVAVRLNSLRAKNFKDDLTELLSSIPGWEIEDQGTYTAGTLASFDGILIQNSSALDPTADARLMMDAFNGAGILPVPNYDATEPGRVRIAIGAPPDK